MKSTEQLENEFNKKMKRERRFFRVAMTGLILLVVGLLTFSCQKEDLKADCLILENQLEESRDVMDTYNNWFLQGQITYQEYQDKYDSYQPLRDEYQSKGCECIISPNQDDCQ